MKVSQLLQNANVKEIKCDLNTEISGVAYDSRKVTEGSLFVAITGFVTDGNRFVPMAMEKGAAVVVTEVRPEIDVPYVLVESSRLALSQIGANFYNHPAEAMEIIGITGTNGKTSSTLLLKHVLEKALGAKVGLIGTMSIMIGEEEVPSERTTPESLELQALFAKMRDAGCSHVIMEVSSHAIALDRVGGIHYRVAAFTNLTEDHLDFHPSMEHYCDTKAEIFARCDAAVVNIDDVWSQRILTKANCPVLTTSAKGNANLWAKEAELQADGISFTAVQEENAVPVKLPIPGKFTVYNALTVLGIAVSLGINLQTAGKYLATAKGVKGRIEVVPTPGKAYTVLIDYAHTPDGLENVLSSVKDFCSGRLISVFGCGGDRDPIKRPIMGKIGAELSDIAIITSDNPRSEKPMAIIEDILKGIDSGKNNIIVEENRIIAIHQAMDIAKKNDIIVLAGKGHETYQEVCGVKHHMDEREIVADYLEKTRN